MASCGAETTQHVIAAQSNDSPTERDRIKHERVHPCVPVSVSCVPFACVPASPIFENDTSKSTTNDAVRDGTPLRDTARHGGTAQYRSAAPSSSFTQAQAAGENGNAGTNLLACFRTTLRLPKDGCRIRVPRRAADGLVFAGCVCFSLETAHQLVGHLLLS